MATLDFAPLYHSTVGFDRLPDLLNGALQRDEGGYPSYTIEKAGEDTYRIVMALAGFSKDDVEVVTKNNRLSIRGRLMDKTETRECLTWPTTSRVQLAGVGAPRRIPLVTAVLSEHRHGGLQ